MLPASIPTDPTDGLRGAAVAAAGPEPQSYVTILNPNDILLGRGRPVVRYEGNIRFRKLVKDRKPQYRATGRNIIKDAIARELKNIIKARGGRFLRKIESVIEAEELGVPRGVQAWVPVDEAVLLQKVKQAFRDGQRAEAESKADGLLSISDRSPVILAASESGVRDQASMPCTTAAAAEHLALLLNRGAARQLATSVPQDPSSSLHEKLAILRARQAAQSAQQWQPSVWQGIRPDASAEASVELMRLREDLMERSRVAEHLQMAQASATSGVVNRFLLSQALAELQAQRMREEQLQNTFFARQGSQSEQGLLGGGDRLSSAHEQFNAHDVWHSQQNASERFLGAMSLEQQILTSQGLASLPAQASGISQSSSLVQQIASARAAQDMYDLSVASAVPNATSPSQRSSTEVVSGYPASSQSFAAMPVRNHGLDNIAATDSSSRDAAVEAWLRSMQGTDPQSKPEGK